MTVTQKSGTFKVVDDEGNTIELYPNILTDTSLSESSKAADGARVGEKIAAIESSISSIESSISSIESEITSIKASDVTSTAITSIEYVTALPEDAADHPTTLYLIKEK